MPSQHLVQYQPVKSPKIPLFLNHVGTSPLWQSMIKPSNNIEEEEEQQELELEVAMERSHVDGNE